MTWFLFSLCAADFNPLRIKFAEESIHHAMNGPTIGLLNTGAAARHLQAGAKETMMNSFISARAYSHPTLKKCNWSLCSVFLHENLSTKQTLRKYLKITWCYHHHREESKEILDAEVLLQPFSELERMSLGPPRSTATEDRSSTLLVSNKRCSPQSRPGCLRGTRKLS